MKPESFLAPAFKLTEIVDCLKCALAEDIGIGDVTTNSIVPADAVLQGRIVAKDAGVVAGLDLAEGVFRLLEDQIVFVPGVTEGARHQRHSAGKYLRLRASAVNGRANCP